MSELKIPTKFVPASISQANLAKYSDDELKQIEKAYQAIKARKLDQSPATKASVTAIFGSHGTGVTTLLKSIRDNFETRPVVCNAEALIKEVTSYNQDVSNMVQLYPDMSERAATELVTARWMPAGKFMHDKLMEDALKEGRPVLISKRGRTEGGVMLLEAINNAGISLNTILYQAPLSVKLQGAESHYSELRDIAFTQAEIVEGHNNLSNNLLALAEKSVGQLSLYFRVAGKDAECVMTVRGDNDVGMNDYQQGLFNGVFYGQDISVDQILEARERGIRAAHPALVA